MSLSDLLSFRQCVSCHQFGRYICQECLSKSSYVPLVCPICRRPSFYGKTHNPCRSDHSPDGGIAIWKYDGVIKDAIKTLKYKFAYTIAEELSEHMLKEFSKHRFEFISPLLVPIPLHRARERWRGFNQAEEIARNIAKKMQWSVQTDLLLRSKSGDSQVNLRPFFRSRNIRGKFAVNVQKVRLSDEIEGKTILLFDDVWTTGSTLFEATRVLKKAGAKEVWIMSVAR